MERVTVSSSLKFKESIKQAISNMAEMGIVGVFPNLETDVKKEDVDLKFMKQLEAEHFKAIEESKVLYVICPEGYVGTLVSVEIGYATAREKPVIFSEQPSDLGLQAVAKDYIPLEELSRLKEYLTEK